MSAIVSIIIPTFNRATIISETLHSVSNQSFVHWECLVIDDGSTDNTEELVQNFIEKDARFHYYKRPDSYKKGANGCRNYGYTLSKGQFINWLDSDDLFSEDKLEAQVSEIQNSLQNSGLVVSCKWNRFETNVTGILPKVTHINKTFDSGLELLKTFNKFASFFPSHAYLVSRDLVEKSDGWDENILVNQDGEFFTRILIKATKVLHPDDGLVYYRSPQIGGVSQFQSKEKIHSAIQSWRLITAQLDKEAPKVHFPFIDHAKNYLFEKIEDRSLQRSFPTFFRDQLRRQRFWYRIKAKLLSLIKRS